MFVRHVPKLASHLKRYLACSILQASELLRLYTTCLISFKSLNELPPELRQIDAEAG